MLKSVDARRRPLEMPKKGEHRQASQWGLLEGLRPNTAKMAMTALVNHDPPPRGPILACHAINVIDTTVLERLEALNRRPRDRHIGLYFAEVKGPVMNRSSRTALLETLNGRVCLSTFDAWYELHGHGPVLLSSP